MIADRPLTAQEARGLLADEWRAADPKTPEEVREFYRTALHQAADLEAFHERADRAMWTDVLLQIARQITCDVYVDIGSGLGTDLAAIDRELGIDVEAIGVEPCDDLRRRYEDAFATVRDVAEAPIERADLISCFDVLEHVYDPEAWLTGIVQRMKVGSWLLETCATADIGTPLHLRTNAGWHPGHVMEANGFVCTGAYGRLRIWRRDALEPIVQNTIIMCIFRDVAKETFQSVINTLRAQPEMHWRVAIGGEAGINRARSAAVSRWYRETADDVFLMVDDDIVFAPADARRIVNLCRGGHDIIAGAYPVRDGSHLAIRALESDLMLGPGREPVEVEWASTGFFAVHRRVVAEMVKHLPLCHIEQEWAFWPLFDFAVVEDKVSGGPIYLSEDWFFCHAARKLGFQTWVDCQPILGHMANVMVSAANMHVLQQALTV